MNVDRAQGSEGADTSWKGIRTKEETESVVGEKRIYVQVLRNGNTECHRREGACRKFCREARGHGGPGVGLQSPGEGCLGIGTVNACRCPLL